MADYIDKLLLPKELKLEPEHIALVISDKFKGQGMEHLLTCLEENHRNVVMVPTNCILTVFSRWTSVLINLPRSSYADSSMTGTQHKYVSSCKEESK